MKLPTALPALLTLLFTCAPLPADGGHPGRLGPMPPDPLVTNRVPVPHSAASLALRQMTTPPALFFWELMKETEALQPDQLRTLLHDLLRVRRYYDQESPADFIVLEAWADRDLAAAAADVLNIPDWEDRSDEIGGYDSDVEFEGTALWARLAERDFPAALKIAEGLQGTETLAKFMSDIGSLTTFKPEQMPAFLNLVNSRMPGKKEARERTVRQALERILCRRGSEEAVKAWQQLPPGPERQEADEFLTKLRRLRKTGSLRWPPVVSTDAELTALTALDSLEPNSQFIPFPLLRAVLKLTPAQSIALGKKAAAEKLKTQWLPWMLYMRAAEGDPAAAAPIASGLSTIFYSVALDGVPSALSAAQPGAEKRLRKMPPGRARDEALTGFLTRADLAQADRWISLAKDLDANIVAWTPFLARMASTGAGPKALKTAAAVSDRFDSGLVNSTMQAWALHDFPAASRFILAAVQKKKETPYFTGYIHAMYRLPSATVLDALPVELMNCEAWDGGPHEQYWTYLAFEDTGAGFRFMERIAARPQHAEYEVTLFTAAAVRLQPERTLEFVRKFPQPSAPELTHFRRLAAHWPDRVITLAEGVQDDQVWLTIGATLVYEHPDRAEALLKDVKNPAAQKGATLARSGRQDLLPP